MQKDQKKKEKGQAFGSLKAILLGVALLSCVLLFGISTSAASSGVGADVNVTLNGRAILEDEAVIINSVTYVPVRSFSEEMGADSVSWNSSTRSATVKKGSTTVTLTEGKSYISANGRYFYTVEKILNIGGKLYVPVRPMCEAFCVSVEWNGGTRTVELTTSGRALVRGADFYVEDEVYWLARIISAEAAGEPLKGKIAVGNVVLNRVRSSSYPNTIYGVIFDRKHGTQFSPVSMGTIYNTPTAESVIAAKICLEGYSISDRILFFMNPRIATSNWISKNRPFAFRIGNHDFYY